VHFNDRGIELEKLTSLDGPTREVIRGQGEARSYYPDAKVVRIEPIAFRNAFPSLSLAEQKGLTENYELRRAETGRVAGLDAQAWVFEPKDGLRFGHKFWVDTTSGLLLKARVINERGDVVEQFSFTDLALGVPLDRALVRPTWSGTAPDWKLQRSPPNDIETQDTGWVVNRVPPGFVKVAEGYRVLRDRQDPVAHLVYSDGLTSVSIFVEKIAAAPRSIGPAQQGGINIYVRPFDDRVVTVLGEVPSATVRQMAHSVSRR
jgi:sigma-E factor negative regulatory protein RseB